jgi:hypothetical protein
MFRKKKSHRLDPVIEKVLDDLKVYHPSEAAFDNRMLTIERLYALKALETPKPEAISPDTVANVGANLLGILMIIRHEHVNVIASKALGLITRTR